MAWNAETGSALNFELVSRLVDDETGARREVRKLAVDNGFIWHFVTFQDKQRTESCTFVPSELAATTPQAKGKK